MLVKVVESFATVVSLIDRVTFFHLRSMAVLLELNPSCRNEIWPILMAPLPVRSA